MLHFTLSAEEGDQTRAAVAGLASEVDELDVLAGSGGTEFFRALPVAARRLPERLLRFLEVFRREEPAGGFVLGGWTVVDGELGPTPAHWRKSAGTAGTASVHELYLLLVASALGDVFAWSTVQDGSLVQDLLPVRGEELEKNAGSSASVLDLHNEDAFSALRCDYLGLLCLRNDDRVPTVYAPFDPTRLSPEQRRILSEPRYLLTVSYTHQSAPYLAFDEYFIETDPEDEEARAALAALTDQLQRSRSDVALAPGELLMVDNYRAVHGRQPFPARYDGRDRWLKRVGVTRDLRRSRAARADVGSPVVLTGLAGAGS